MRVHVHVRVHVRACVCLEEPHLVLVVADEHVLRVAVVVQHHLVVLSAEARLLVPAEGRVGRVEVVAVDPHPARLDGPGDLVDLVRVARPHARAQAVDGVVGDGHRLVGGLEGGDGGHRAEYLLLEDAHAVGALEDGGLDVVAAAQLSRELVDLPAHQQLRSLRLADVQVLGDAVHLALRNLRAHHALGVQGVSDLDHLDPLQHPLHELLVDVFVHQHAAGAGADLPLVQGEHHGPLDGLVEEGVVVLGHAGHEDHGRLAAQFHGNGDDGLGCGLHHALAGDGGSRERDLGDAVGRGQRRARLRAEARDDVEHSWGQQVPH
mmetsp:Transcript_28936/g.62347  ORF Transcript_28936/g.62347 Transcript_28936/m.62347 type:complete len:321 (-) Transcript_28936:696-1658(-)